MNDNYLAARKFADSLEDKLIKILYKNFTNTILDYYDYEKDTKKCTDITLVQTDGVELSVGERIRKFDYLQYSNEFTLRQTELKKILQGYGNFIIYAFSNYKETDIIKYSIIDLDVFRSNFKSGAVMHNTDNSPSFQCFNYKDFPNSLVISSWENKEDIESSIKQKSIYQQIRLKEIYETIRTIKTN